MAQVSSHSRPSIGSKLGLSAGRFGLDWSAGDSAQLDDLHVRTVLDEAAAQGIRVVDAGSVYGEAEATLGATLPSPNPFRIVLRSRRGLRPEHVGSAVETALANLWLPSADTLLLDGSADLAGVGGDELWTTCERLRGGGLIDRIGFTATAEDDVLAIARRLRPDVVQLPVSLLDQRLVQNGVLARLADLGVEIHLRSIFLHGLLFVPLERLPGRLKGSAGRLKRVREMLAEAGVDPLAAGLRYVLDRPEADCVLVSVAGPEDLHAILGAASAGCPPLNWSAMALDDPSLLDPRRWAA